MNAYLHFFTGNPASLAQPDSQRSRDGTTADTAFLATTGLDSLQSDSRSSTNVDGTNTLGSVQFVTRDTHKIDVHGVNIDGNLSASLSCIGVEEDFLGAAEFTNFLDRLDDSDFVVDSHDRDEGSVRTNGFLQLLQVDDTVALNRQIRHFETFILENTARIEHAFVFLLPNPISKPWMHAG